MHQRGPEWMSIFWPHYTALRDSASVVLLETPYFERPAFHFATKLSLRKERQLHAKRLVKTVEEQLDPKGPNILLVWALNAVDIQRSTFLDPVWNRFDHRVLSILDTIEIENIDPSIVKRFDLQTAICGDIGHEFSAETGVPHIYFPPHVDSPSYISFGDYRPIDMMIVGRRDKKRHDRIHEYFSARDKETLSVDFLSRAKNYTPETTETEALHLLQAYGRSKISFCFEPGPWARFRNRSPLTERWVHSWISGCTVMGSAPKGRGTEAQQDWPESTIELPDSPEDSIRLIEETLDEKSRLLKRRLHNVEEAIRRHDTRHRLKYLFDTLDHTLPEKLTDGLSRISELADTVRERRRAI